MGNMEETSDLRNGRVGAIVILLIAVAVLLTVAPRTDALSAPIEARKGHAEATSYIIQGTNVSKAAAAVEAVGGTVTQELGTINAVGGSLVPAQISSLPDSVKIQENRSLTTDGSNETVPDEFSEQTYGSNDGIVDLAGDWTETNDFNETIGGDIPEQQ